mmetsp:Transcript_7969/g.16710  ORF Transcript_7969/g.16710 Transcript_7969/m.16710 type:complete len:407 (+) Transcript_7969:71-1291(+)
MERSFGRSPTFLVGTETQKFNLDQLQRREQHLAEQYHKNKPLCFNARSYQKTHPVKDKEGHRDADVCLESPMILGVADGVSQVEEFGIDASLLPRELLRYCEDLGMYQLVPSSKPSPQDAYKGPVPLLKEAFEATESLGSTTVVLALLDNSTRIHGKLHPMIAVITVGDCELIVLRRIKSRQSPLEAVFRTEMQRIDGHVQTPLQLARVDGRIDPDFHDGITIEVIEKGSAVHCVSAYEGDIIIMGSDGVFDNLFLDEIADLANSVLQPGRQIPTHEALLGHLAKRIVQACHAKTQPGTNGVMPEAPIGRGGKMDDTSCVVAEVIEWTDAHSKVWAPRQSRYGWQNFMTCGSGCAASDDEVDGYDDEMMPPGHSSKTPHSAVSSRGDRSYVTEGEEAEDERGCSIA